MNAVHSARAQQALGVDAANSLLQGDIVFFRDQKLGVDATVLQICYDAGSNFTIIDAFPEQR